MSIIEICLIIIMLVMVGMVIFLILFLARLDKALKKWKRIGEIVELGWTPLIWAISFCGRILEEVLEIGKKEKEE